MQLCTKHWDKVQRSFGHEDVTDVKERYKLVCEDYGSDPWFGVNVVVWQKLLERVDPKDFGENPMRLQDTVELAGGCPVCFLNEGLLDDAIEATKEVMSRRRSAS